MPVIEYINGIMCVFPESKEASFQKFADEVAEAVYRCAMRGEITLEQLEEMTKGDQD